VWPWAEQGHGADALKRAAHARRSAGNATPEWIRNWVLGISTGDCHMRNEFTAIIARAGDWYIAYCPEISGANG
jgi:hypothetical protein